MRKSLLLLLVLGALSLVACSGAGGPTAATVDGVNITVSEVQMMRLDADPEAAVVDKAQFANDLTNAIFNVALIAAAKSEFGIDPTEAEVSAKLATIESEIQAMQGISGEEFLATQGIGAEQLSVIARQQVIKDALDVEFLDRITPATDAEAEELLGAERIARTTACVSHLLVVTEEEATAALDRIDGGEDFATVAAEVGTDATAANGGELGCESLGAYVPEFAEASLSAPIGEVVGPVETEFGFHLILVTSREEPALADIKTEIDLQRVNGEIFTWIVETRTAAEGTVESEFGTWVTDPNPQVQAPTS
ncbi:MAG: peptidylprolyl isomerase [Acidimicrobiia bacterium]